MPWKDCSLTRTPVSEVERMGVVRRHQQIIELETQSQLINVRHQLVIAQLQLNLKYSLFPTSLIEKRIKALPNRPLLLINLRLTILTLVVGNICKTYKILLMCMDNFRNLDSEEGFLCIYESSFS